MATKVSKCPFCDGTGVMTHRNDKGEMIMKEQCRYCNGRGKDFYVYESNNEWRKTCSAEEFAEFLANIGRDAVIYGGGRNFTTKEYDIKYWIGWLKQPHQKE